MPFLQPGASVGASYRLVAKIGTGATGEVWQARNLTTNAVVAAKILKTEHAGEPHLVERFVRERSVLIGLDHQHIVRVQDLVIEGPILAILMDYLPGGSLREVLKTHRRLTPGDALTLTSEVMKGLAHAHAKNITHRDIKPDNVLLKRAWHPGESAIVCVSDFGIAAVVSEETRVHSGLVGTPRYMAPEYVRDANVSPAIDVYSTATLLYEMLVGRTPFGGSGSDFTIAYKQVTGRVARLDVPDPLWDYMERMLSKDPHVRPSAQEAARRLAEFAHEYGDLPRLEGPPPEIDSDDDRLTTMVKGGTQDYVPSFHHTHAGLATHMPEVGEADHATVVRPHPASAPALDAHGGVGSEGAGAQGGATGEPDLLSRGTGESDSHGVDNGESDPLGRKRGRKTALLVGAGIGAAVLVGVGVFAALGSNAFSETDDVASEPISINQTDRPLPTGLTTTRVASFDPEAQNITLEVTYAGQKSPLSGSFLEVVAPFEGEEACPHVQWEEDAGQPHKASTTGLKAECGWRFDDVVVDVDGQTTFTGTIDATVADRQELEEWLDVTARATEGALTNPEVTSTAYPAQRLQDIAVEVPERMVSQTPVEITLLPVWPSGEDELNPLMRSPVSGAPSTMLVDIAGSFDNVRFSDGCSGSVAVSSDGLSAMALSVSTDCQIRAKVGNFTDLESNSFRITTRN